MSSSLVPQTVGGQSYGHPQEGHTAEVTPDAYAADLVRALEFHRARAEALAVLAQELLDNHRHRSGEWAARLQHLTDDRITPSNGLL
jgi:hypothetical protein